MSGHDLSLLNIYEVEDAGRTRYLVGFQEAVLAGSIGLVSHAMIGEFTPGPDGEFDPATFAVNPEFLEAFTRFINGEPGRSPAAFEPARQIPGERLYLVDPRNQSDSEDDPPQEDVLGSFEVDQEGRIVPDSFKYNAEHRWFSTATGVSGFLRDRGFYEWLHAIR